MDKYEIGEESTLSVGGQTDIPITNVSYTADKNTSEVQFNDSLFPTVAVTGMSYSGSFEHTGSNAELQSAIADENGVPIRHDQGHIQITVQESERTVIFRGVVVNSRSKDIPSDDRTSETYDFVAEKMIVN